MTAKGNRTDSITSSIITVKHTTDSYQFVVGISGMWCWSGSIFLSRCPRTMCMVFCEQCSRGAPLVGRFVRSEINRIGFARADEYCVYFRLIAMHCYGRSHLGLGRM
jgi:hypothetical protein